MTMATQHRQHDEGDHEHVHSRTCGHETVQHGDHVDYLHDGHRHAAHAGHYDEHDEEAGTEDGDRSHA